LAVSGAGFDTARTTAAGREDDALGEGEVWFRCASPNAADPATRRPAVNPAIPGEVMTITLAHRH
jgi:hypothetical protein